MKRITLILMFGCAAMLIGWDIYVYIVGTTDQMISGIIWDTSKASPIVPFLFGFLMGHLFWQKGKE